MNNNKIIRRTPLANDVVVLTVELKKPHSIRPFQVFAVTGTRYALHLSDFTCWAAADHHHDYLVARMAGEHRRR